MIKINELRIGNVVEYNGFHLPVYSITGAYPRKGTRYNNKALVDLVCDGFVTADEDEINPIPITPELLTKCGFKIDQYGDYNLDSICFAMLNGMVFDVMFPNIAYNLQYLHQLQNLYYMMHNKEMEVKL